MLLKTSAIVAANKPSTILNNLYYWRQFCVSSIKVPIQEQILPYIAGLIDLILFQISKTEAAREIL